MFAGAPQCRDAVKELTLGLKVAVWEEVPVERHGNLLVSQTGELHRPLVEQRPQECEQR